MGHLDDINQTYWQHVRTAVTLSLRFMIAAPLLLIHALLPNIFVNAGSNVIEAYHRMMDDRA